MSTDNSKLRSIKNILETDFTEDKLKEYENCIKTGFDGLDRLINGGLRPGINIIGAVPSIGKTTFALQIACNIAMNPNEKERVPVLYFALEESAMMLVAKAVCRAKFEANREAYLNERKNHYDDFYKLLNPSNLSEWEEFKKDISDRGSLLEIYDEPVSADDIVKTVDNYINKNGIKPLVIVDYFQIIKDPDLKFNANSKQIADKNLEIFTELKEKKIPLLLISSLNRSSYNNPLGLESFKESGGIEYSADLLLGLQFSAVHKVNDKGKPIPVDDTYEKSKFPREVEIMILKQRYGPCGDPIKFKFYAPFYYFEEADSRAPKKASEEFYDHAHAEDDVNDTQPEETNQMQDTVKTDTPFDSQNNNSQETQNHTGASLSEDDYGNINSYMNNTKIANEIRKGKAKTDKQNRCKISGKNEPEVYTKYTISSPLTAFDCDVADAVYTVFIRNHHKSFTLRNILHELSGNSKQGLTTQKKAAIGESLDRLMSTEISIDCTDEMRMRKKIKANETVEFKGKFLNAVYDSLNEKYSLANKKFEKDMPLYGYGAMNHQMIRFSNELLNTTDTGVEDTNEIISIKRFLVRKIEILQNSKSNKTRYDTMIKELSIKKKPKKLRDNVMKILESFKKRGYITNCNGYKDKRDGNLCGVEFYK